MQNKTSTYGWIIFILGILMTLFCGGCSIMFLKDSNAELWSIVAILGGIPTLIGIALIFMGNHLRKQK